MTNDNKKNQQSQGDPAKAHEQAEKDILQDPELSDPDPTDDLDEGELARADNWEKEEDTPDHPRKPRKKK